MNCPQPNPHIVIKDNYRSPEVTATRDKTVQKDAVIRRKFDQRIEENQEDLQRQVSFGGIRYRLPRTVFQAVTVTDTL